MSTIFRALALAAVLGLVGCGTLTVDGDLNREITGDTLAACTARAYQSVARRKAWRERNFADAVSLSEKAQAAQAGAKVQLFPSDFRARLLQRVDALTAAHEQAGRALAAAGADSCACGPVAAAYDDWVLESLAGDWDGARARFEAAAAACAPGA